MIFCGAFLPRFVAPGPGPTGQFIPLPASSIAIAPTLDGWARFARALGVEATLRDRLTAGALVGVGAGLALARKS